MAAPSLTEIDAALSTGAPSGIIIERVKPEIDAGRYPIKREVGDTLEVSADIFKEGHDEIAAVVRYRRWDASEWSEAPMRLVENDRWVGSFPLPENTRYLYTIQAFPDVFSTWRHEVEKKVAAGLDVTSELVEGYAIIREAAARAPEADRVLLEGSVAHAERSASQAASVAIVLGEEVAAAVARNRSRAGAATYPRELTVVVDRVRARYAAWYELFPRSAGTRPGQSGTFADAAAHLPRIAAMGFDVVYFPPIHPIGKINRKGKNNTLVAGPDDPGSPYAIGSDLGGHDAIEPSLGTLDDFRAFVEQAKSYGLDVALDFAIQAAPDHPWVKDHPEWFYIRPDGTIKYAENPPKKYEDIYPINFNSSDWRGLWAELKRIVLFWVEQGVNTFRVDNPHTKPTAFWEWLIAEVQRVHPEVIFLSEAFTRPKVMKALAKAGFTQSYTYFTWRNFKREITEYLTELTQTEMVEYFRGNFFTNTPDILPFFLQEGGRPAFRIRHVLAATLSSLYGIYSGFELCENTPVPGKEEYLNSEKYELKVWDWDRPGNIVADITKVNRIRREHPALHEYDNLRFFEAEDDNIICYGKRTPDNADVVVCLVNLDPFQAHETWFTLPIEEFGLRPDEQYRATELLSGQELIWTGARHHWYLDPRQQPAAIFWLRPWQHIHHGEPCFD